LVVARRRYGKGTSYSNESYYIYLIAKCEESALPCRVQDFHFSSDSNDSIVAPTDTDRRARAAIPVAAVLKAPKTSHAVLSRVVLPATPYQPVIGSADVAWIICRAFVTPL